MLNLLITRLVSYREKEMTFKKKDGTDDVRQFWLLFIEDDDAFMDKYAIKSIYCDKKLADKKLLDSLTGKMVQLTGQLTSDNNGDWKLKPEMIQSHEDGNKQTTTNK